MRDEHNKIEVYIKEVVGEGEEGGKDVSALTEYEAPENSPAHTGNPGEYYIVGVADKKFAVHVGLLTGYDTKDWSHLSVEIFVDQHIKAGYPVSFLKRSLRACDYRYYYSGTKSKRQKNELAFDAKKLNTKDDLGSIVVTVRRARATFQAGTRRCYVVDDADHKDKELLTYKFFYASSETLRSLDILPVASPPAASSPTHAKSTASTNVGPRNYPQGAAQKSASVTEDNITYAPKSRHSLTKSAEQDASDASKYLRYQIPRLQAQDPSNFGSMFSRPNTVCSTSQSTSLCPTSQSPGRYSGETFNTASDLGSALHTAEYRSSIAYPVEALVASVENAYDTPAPTAGSTFSAMEALHNKGKRAATELSTGVSNRGDEESLLPKKLRSEVVEDANTSRNTTVPSEISDGTAATPAFKFETDADTDVAMGQAGDWDRADAKQKAKREEERRQNELQELEEAEIEAQQRAEKAQIDWAAARRKREIRMRRYGGE